LDLCKVHFSNGRGGKACDVMYLNRGFGTL